MGSANQMGMVSTILAGCLSQWRLTCSKWW